MAALSVPLQPQSLHEDHPDLTQQGCGPFENVPVSLPVFSPSSAMTDA